MKALRSFAAFCCMSVLATAANADAFTAVLSCQLRGEHINIYACFENTELKVTNNGRTKVYKVYDLAQAGTEHRDGLHIELSENFDLRAQNSQEYLVLGLVVRNASGDIVYEDQAGRYGTVWVGN